MKKEERKQVEKELDFEVVIRGEKVRFVTTWGLFSPKKMDAGSRLLLEKVKVNEGDVVLDLGCGYGSLGVTIARLAEGVEVDMVDKDFVAVDYANKNIKLNQIKNSRAFLSNMLDGLDKDEKYDLIVSNLPAKVSKEMFWIMFDSIEKHLNENGKVYFVIIKGLKKFIKRTFKERFGNCKRVAYNKNYVLYMAEKSQES